MQNFVVNGNSLPSGRASVAQDIGGMACHTNPIYKITVSIGKAPGNLGIGADGDCRRTGKADADDVVHEPWVAGIRVNQAGAEPYIRYPQLQMHIVCDERSTTGEWSGHCKTIAARQ